MEGADSHSDQRPESCPTPEQKGKEVSLDGSQYTPSPASQEDLESDVSDDSNQEVDIEGAGLEEYYATGENTVPLKEKKSQHQIDSFYNKQRKIYFPQTVHFLADL